MHTEASHRFERGADLEATRRAADRCIELIQQLAGGTIDVVAMDAYPRPHKNKSVTLYRAEIQRHLGMEPPPATVLEMLGRLGFSPQPVGTRGWKCLVPSFRVDVTREIDLVEEVARHYGYERFPMRLPGLVEGRPAHRASSAYKDTQLRELCRALGYDETISFVLNSRDACSYNPAEPVALANPLSEEAAVLRTSMVPGLLAALQWNLNRGAETVRLFESGHVYHRDANIVAEPPRLALVATGARAERGLGRAANASTSFEFLDLKGDLEQLHGLFQVGALQADAEGLPDYYRLGHRGRLLANGKAVAWLGELDSKEAAKWKFRRPVYLAEVFLDALYANALRSVRVQAISRYPAVTRDFSILLPENRRFADVEGEVRALGISEITGVEPVEIFRGGQIAEGSYSMLLRVTLQSHELTLAEADLNRFSGRIMTCLQEKLGARIRM